MKKKLSDQKKRPVKRTIGSHKIVISAPNIYALLLVLYSLFVFILPILNGLTSNLVSNLFSISFILFFVSIIFSLFIFLTVLYAKTNINNNLYAILSIVYVLAGLISYIFAKDGAIAMSVVIMQLCSTVIYLTAYNSFINESQRLFIRNSIIAGISVTAILYCIASILPNIDVSTYNAHLFAINIGMLVFTLGRDYVNKGMAYNFTPFSRNHSAIILFIFIVINTLPLWINGLGLDVLWASLVGGSLFALTYRYVNKGMDKNSLTITMSLIFFYLLISIFFINSDAYSSLNIDFNLQNAIFMIILLITGLQTANILKNKGIIPIYSPALIISIPYLFFNNTTIVSEIITWICLALYVSYLTKWQLNRNFKHKNLLFSLIVTIVVFIFLLLSSISFIKSIS